MVRMSVNWRALRELGAKENILFPLEPRGVCEWGDRLYVFGRGIIEVRSKMDGSLIQVKRFLRVIKLSLLISQDYETSLDVESILKIEGCKLSEIFPHHVEDAIITNGKLYVLYDLPQGVKVLDLDLNPIQYKPLKEELNDDTEYKNLASYNGFLYVSGWVLDRSEQKFTWFVEKREIDDLSLVKRIKGKVKGKSDCRMVLNPAVGQLWVMIHGGEEDEGVMKGEEVTVIKIFDQELHQVKEIKMRGKVCSIPDFDEEGNAYLTTVITDPFKPLLHKFDSHGNQVRQKGLHTYLNVAGVKYANGHLYIVGEVRDMKLKRNVVCAFDEDLSLVDELRLSDGEVDLPEQKLTSDDKNLYIVGGGREVDPYKNKYKYYWCIYSISLINSMPKGSRLKSSLLTVPLNAFAIDLSSIISLRVASLEGLLYGYGPADSKSFELSLPVGVVPRGFEGNWTCHLLGRGGWSSAYLLSRNGQRVVVKVPRGLEAVIEGGEHPTIHERLLERVKREAEIVSSLDHPNILKLLGVSEKLALVIYEYAEFGSLYWQLARGWRPALRDVLLLGIQIGDAVRYVHSRGLIHGDVKPSNVLIKDRIAKLGDFSSMVRLLSSASFSKMAFTIGFRAPEQVYADLRKRARELGVENRIDVYQLGNVLLYTLTGESVDGEEAFNDKLVLEKLRGVSNEDLRSLLAKALVPEPEKRPSAEEFTKMLYAMWLKVARS
jgi:hypothetical protein